jgi:ATP-dependent DNA helicase RecQ
MTYYCYTRDCLREYILQYFGQYGDNCCDNCSNCLAHFDEVDVSDISRDIIGCIRESGQRFGINVIIGTLMGSRTAKLTATNMVSSSFYGRRASEREHYLKQIMNKLMMDGYLYLTNDKYAVIKLDKSAQAVEKGDLTVKMKLPQDSAFEKQASSDKQNKNKRKSEILTSKGLDLFEILRQVRTNLAREEGMPPYIIFSDKTLTDMCCRLPFNRDEMLTVTGVGINKLDKYGQSFLDAILQFTQGEKQELCYEQPGEEVKPKQNLHLKAGKTEFLLTKNILENFKPEGEIQVGKFVELLNELRDEQRMKRLTAVSLTSKLREGDYITDKFSPLLGRNMTTVTEKGLSLGISTLKRVSEKGNEYETLVYNEEAQRFLLSLIGQEDEL